MKEWDLRTGTLVRESLRISKALWTVTVCGGQVFCSFSNGILRIDMETFRPAEEVRMPSRSGYAPRLKPLPRHPHVLAACDDHILVLFEYPQQGPDAPARRLQLFHTYPVQPCGNLALDVDGERLAISALKNPERNQPDYEVRIYSTEPPYDLLLRIAVTSFVVSVSLQGP